VNVLRNIGIGIGVIALLAVGAWQLDQEGELVTPVKPPSKQEREIAGLKTITAYCQYGSASKAQMEGCYFHVHLGEIEGRDTNAAKWAKGELDECLDDAGPYCGTQYRETLEKRIDEKAKGLESG
jgi:hypothetical protein